MNRILALIVARGGSKSLPRKNLLNLAGKPLIAHTCLAATASQKLDRVILSTDDREIAAAARECGAEVPFLRPDELAGDTTPVIDVALHALKHLDTQECYQPDFVMLLQPTSPLRTTADIDAAIEMADRTGANAVVSVSEAESHPYLMKTMDAAGRLSPFIETTLSGSRRQDLPPVYALNGALYLVRRSVLLDTGNWCPEGALGYTMPPERSVDIDTAADLQLAETLFAARPVSAVTIAGHRIGPDRPCFVIAEAGVNHNGDLDMALRLVDAAAAAGADAVKFQTFRAEQLVTRQAAKADYQKQTTDASESQFDMLKRLELGEAAHRRIVAHCREKKIIFLSTPFDDASADFLDSLGMPAFKIGSGDLTNLPLLRHIALKGKPVILSTGMGDLAEVEAAVTTVRNAGNDDLVLLHCVSNYPADPADANLRAMRTLATACQAPTGYSDHTAGIAVAIAAAALGACIIEKHLTLDRGMPGPDHRASLEPVELATMICAIRNVEKALGDGKKTPSASEMGTARVARRSLVAARDIGAGEAIDAAAVTIQRPGTGLPASKMDRVMGLRAKTDIQRGTLLSLDMLERPT